MNGRYIWLMKSGAGYTTGPRVAAATGATKGAPRPEGRIPAYRQAG